MKRKLTAFFFCLSMLGAVNAGAELAPSAQEIEETAQVQVASVAAPLCSDVADGVHSCAAETAASDPKETLSLTDMTTASSQQGCASLVLTEEVNNNLFTLSAIDNGDCASVEARAAKAELFPDVPIVVNKKVESFISYFQTRGRKYFERWMGRSKDYMTMLKGTLNENGLPEDLSYIAFIESGLNPTAKSHANAVGMWQFIRGTAVRYGLRVDWWIDERMDPEKATVAASKYFKNLYDQFGSWYLAAAGYNAGEGKVARAIKKHDTEDFWELASYKKPFRRETKEYVPKYLAALLISKDPKSYGFDAVEHNDALPYEKVTVSQPTDLRVIADAAGISVEEIKRLNPELLRWFTPPNYPNYQIKLPIGTTERYVENMSKLPQSQKIAFRMHKVKRGETVSKIAKKYGSQTQPIMYVNNLQSTSKKLKPGTVIAIPVKADGVARNGQDFHEVIAHTELLQS